MTPQLGQIHRGNYFGTTFTLHREETEDDTYFLVLHLENDEARTSIKVESVEDMAYAADFPTKVVSRITELVKAKLAEHPVEADDLLQ